MLKSPSLPDAFIGLGRNRMSLVNRCFHINICQSFLGLRENCLQKKVLIKRLERLLKKLWQTNNQMDPRGIKGMLEHDRSWWCWISMKVPSSLCGYFKQSSQQQRLADNTTSPSFLRTKKKLVNEISCGSLIIVNRIESNVNWNSISSPL